MAATNASVGEGRPAYVVQDIPPENTVGAPSLDITRPQIYFGQLTRDYVVVNSKLSEVDGLVETPGTGDAEPTTTTGPSQGEEESPTTTGPGGDAAGGEDADTGTFTYPTDVDSGIPINSFWRRLAFSLRMRDVKLLLSGDFTDESRIMFDRQISDRVSSVAPFLTLDRTPYMSIVDGDLVVWQEGQPCCGRSIRARNLATGASPCLEEPADALAR